MDFKQHLVDLKLAPTTIKTHMSKYELLIKNDVNFDNPQELIHFIKQQDTLSKQKTLSSTISRYLTFTNKSNDEVVKYIKELNKKLSKEHIKRSQTQVDGSVSYMELVDFMDKLYEQEKWRDFVIIYCFVNFCSRNQDLIAEVIIPNHDKDDDKNYFVVSNKKDSVMWYRNNYKTNFKYDRKITKISSKRFVNAISKLDYVLKPNDNFDRLVKKITEPIGSITQSVICKLVLASNPSMNPM